MKNLILLNLKPIIKKKLIIIYLIFLVGVEAILLRYSLMDATQSNSIYYASSFNNISIIFFIFFSIFSYEIFKNIKDAELYETFSANKNGLAKVWISRLMVLLLLASISMIPIFVHYTLLYLKYNFNRLYYINTLMSLILDFLFVSAIGCILGALISINNNRGKGYIKIAVSAFLLSPLLVSFISIIYMYSGNFSSLNIFPLINRIQILPPNLRLGSHAIYGLPMEAIRWESAIMLIIILIIAILRKLSIKRKVLLTYILSGIIIIWSAFALIITPDDSLVRKDERYFDGETSDYYYDLESPQQQESPTFTVAEYNMNFKVRRQLHGDVEIVIGEKSEDNIYHFTLYRGYNIISITDQDGNELKYTREGHYISISAYLDIVAINIKYKGQGNRFYSNNQGIALTGNFPYYPVAGYSTIAIHPTNNEVKFNVTVDTKQELFSNLDGKNNQFSGISDTVTLVSGFLKEYYSGNITVIGCSIYEDNINIADLQTEMDDINLKLGTDFNLNNKNMTLFYPPDNIFQGDGYIGYAMLYDNQIITEGIDTTWICRGIVESSLPDEQDTFILRYVFLDTLFYMDSISENYSPKYPTDAEIETYKNPGNENYFQKESVIAKLLMYKIDELGEEKAFSQVYDYLINYDGSVEQLDFLLGME